MDIAAPPPGRGAGPLMGATSAAHTHKLLKQATVPKHHATINHARSPLAALQLGTRCPAAGAGKTGLPGCSVGGAAKHAIRTRVLHGVAAAADVSINIARRQGGYCR